MPTTSVQDAPVFRVLGNLSDLTPERRTQLERDLSAIGVEILDLETELKAAGEAAAKETSRRNRIPETFADEIEWEREFGAERCPPGYDWHQKRGFWVECWKHLARRYGMTYEAVKGAYLKVWADRDAAAVTA